MKIDGQTYYCEGLIQWSNGLHQCTSGASIQRDGKYFCWQHDPHLHGKKKRDIAAKKISESHKRRTE